MPTVSIVDTGVANIASVRAAFERQGVAARSVKSPDDIVDAGALVLPGVGAFGPAMERLSAMRLVDALRARISADRPTLCICLGMQLLCTRSDESRGVEGLGLIDASIEPIDGPRRTHFGWSAISAPSPSLVDVGYAYFAHSFALRHAPDGWTPTFAAFGERFVASLERSNVVACQFHPELSGPWGASLLQRWLTRAASLQETTPCAR
jgi:imidazole glycerol phosphate synthase glutamine amidotransferase subunit